MTWSYSACYVANSLEAASIETGSSLQESRKNDGRLGQGSKSNSEKCSNLKRDAFPT